MQIEHSKFGEISGQEVKQYILENDHGMIVKIMDYGATVTSIQLPSNKGLIEVVCGFDTLEGYLSEEYKANNPYFGTIIGRYANRIKAGRFQIKDRRYQLTQNDGKNHLHGGNIGFDKKIWKSNIIESTNAIGVELRLFSKHLEEGYPGNVDVKISYQLNNENELIINYFAKTDQKTPLALTNHTYFNLSGFKEDILSHDVLIKAEKYLKKDETNCPDGLTEKVTLPLDFRIDKTFKQSFKNLKSGIDHNYVFDKPLWSLQKVAEFKYSKLGIGMEVITDEPGMQLYTGNHISNKLSRNINDKYGPLSAFCCETQRYPNGVNIKDAPGSFTDEKEPFQCKTIYKFKLGESNYE